MKQIKIEENYSIATIARMLCEQLSDAEIKEFAQLFAMSLEYRDNGSCKNIKEIIKTINDYIKYESYEETKTKD